MRILQRLFGKVSRPCTDCPLAQGGLGEEAREARPPLIPPSMGRPEKKSFDLTPDQRELVRILARQAGAHEAEVVRACIAIAAPLLRGNPNLVEEYHLRS